MEENYSRIYVSSKSLPCRTNITGEVSQRTALSLRTPKTSDKMCNCLFFPTHIPFPSLSSVSSAPIRIWQFYKSHITINRFLLLLLNPVRSLTESVDVGLASQRTWGRGSIIPLFWSINNIIDCRLLSTKCLFHHSQRRDVALTPLFLPNTLQQRFSDMSHLNKSNHFNNKSACCTVVLPYCLLCIIIRAELARETEKKKKKENNMEVVVVCVPHQPPCRPAAYVPVCERKACSPGEQTMVLSPCVNERRPTSQLHICPRDISEPLLQRWST